MCAATDTEGVRVVDRESTPQLIKKIDGTRAGQMSTATVPQQVAYFSVDQKNIAIF